jgi:hypothetical protein
MLAVLAQLTLKKTKIKSFLSYFRGLVVLHTLEHSRADQIKCIVSQLDVVRCKPNFLAKNAWLAG